MPVVKVNPEFFNNDAQTNFNPETHANPGLDLKHIACSSTNILFEGIRGTGKTHILKMIRNECITNFNTNRVLPIYISLAKMSEYEALEEDLFRIHLYTSIVQGAIDAINSNMAIIEKADNPFTLKLLRTDAPIWELYAEKPIHLVMAEVKELFDKLNHDLMITDFKVSKDKSKKGSGEFGGSGFKASGSYSTQEKIEYVIQRLSHNNASRYIVEFFKGLHNILELDYSVLLIDEISGISDQAQIEVFRLLKLIRASTEKAEGNNFLYFIGSVYPPHSTNYPSKARNGFEFVPGEDCSMEYLEMDVLYDEYESFFSYIIERRLEMLHPESEGNYLWLFEDEKAFLLTAFTANGLPRRFFEIIKTAYNDASKKYSSLEETKRIDLSSIRSAIQTVVDSQTLIESQLNETDFYYLEKMILPKLSQRNTSAETKNEAREETKRLPVHLFLSVSRADRIKLANLIYRGVIHNLSRTRKSKSVSSEPKGIMMMLDLAVAYNYRVFNVQNAVEYFQVDLRENAKGGYRYYSELSLDD